jgi:hypothetical protein
MTVAMTRLYLIQDGNETGLPNDTILRGSLMIKLGTFVQSLATRANYPCKPPNFAIFGEFYHGSGRFSRWFSRSGFHGIDLLSNMGTSKMKKWVEC